MAEFERIFQEVEHVGGVLFAQDPLPLIEKICEETGLLFVDTVFPANDSSISKHEASPLRAGENALTVAWDRAHPLARLPVFGGDCPLAEQEVCPTGVIYIGDLVSVISCMGRNLEILQGMISLPESISACGAYSVRFFVQGRPMWVVVDNFFPCNEMSIPLTVFCSKSLWPNILEKAYAKLCGHYDALRVVDEDETPYPPFPFPEPGNLAPLSPYTDPLTLPQVLRDFLGMPAFEMPIEHGVPGDMFRVILEALRQGGAGLVHWRETTEKEDEDGVVLPFEEGYGFMVRNYLLRKAHELVYVVPMYKTAGKVFEGKWWSNSFIWEDLAEDKRALGIQADRPELGTWMETDEISENSDKLVVCGQCNPGLPYTFVSEGMTTGNLLEENEMHYFLDVPTGITAQLHVDLSCKDLRLGINARLGLFRVLDPDLTGWLGKLETAKSSKKIESLSWNEAQKGLETGRYVVVPFASQSFQPFSISFFSDHPVRVSAYPPSELVRVEEMFSTLDKDSSGNLSARELSRVFQICGQLVDGEDVATLIKRNDLNCDGEINREEFLRLLSARYVPPSARKWILERSFQALDVDGNGYLDAVEFVDFLLSAQPSLSQSEVDQILRRVDRNGDGKVVCEEFVKYMME